MAAAPASWVSNDGTHDPFLTIDSRWTRIVDVTHVVAAGLAAAVGGLLFVQWVFDPKAAFASGVLMQWNTAAAVFILGVAFLLVRTRTGWAAAAAGVAFLLGISALIADIRGTAGPIEQLIGPVPVHVEPGLMGPAPAVLVAGLALPPIMLWIWTRWHLTRGRWIISTLTGALIMVLISVFGIQVYFLIELSRGGIGPIGFRQANWGFGALLLSWVCVWVLDGQWRPLLAHGISATALRWLTVVSILLPVIPGTILTFAVASGWVQPIAAVALMAGFVAAGGLGVSARVFFALRTLERSLIEQAMVDPLTGLWNVGAFTRLADQKFADARRHRDTVALIVFDLDGLKLVNDSYGHAAGSDMIRAMAHAIALSAREEDVAARIGGDEFALIMRASESAANDVLDRVRHIASDLDASAVHAWQLSFSAGLASSDGFGSVDDLLRRADTAMYADKTERRRTRSQS